MDFSGQLDFGNFSWGEGKEKEVEPFVDLYLLSGERIIFRASRMSYTRDEFPHDSYDVAAKKVADHFIAWRDSLNLPRNKPISYHVASYQEHEARIITFSKDGVQHNYDNLDTWHHWFMEVLSSKIRERW